MAEDLRRFWTTNDSEEKPRFDRLISSPAARCVQTLIRVSQEMVSPSNLVATDQITLEKSLHPDVPRVDETNQSLSLDTVLDRVIRTAGGAAAAIVSLHADLALALPMQFFADQDQDRGGIFIDPGDRDENGSFCPKPVLVVVRIDPGGRIKEASLLRYRRFDR